MEINTLPTKKYYAKGKLLLSGEYFVLDGALAFAVPTKKGQYIEIAPRSEKDHFLHWTSMDHEGNTWFDGKFDLKTLQPDQSSDTAIANRLSTLLQYLQRQKADFFSQPIHIKTQLEFDRNWGFGSSSTLLSNLAQWTDTNPFEFAQNTFGGSGYDIACATAKSSIFYRKTTEAPHIQPFNFAPAFIDNLFLVWLGKKQDSRQGIETYRNRGTVDPGLIRQVSQLSMMLAKSADLSTFCSCIQELERLTGDFLGMTPLQEKLFAAMPGAVKSLGAWGGDFALLATPWKLEKVKTYCKGIGMEEVFGFGEMV